MSAARWAEHPPGRNSTCPICTPEPHWHGPVPAHHQYEVLTMEVTVKCFNESVPAVKHDCSPLLLCFPRFGCGRVVLGAVPSGLLLVAGRTFSLCIRGIEAWESPGVLRRRAGTSAQLLKSGPFPLSFPCVHPLDRSENHGCCLCQLLRPVTMGTG